MHVAAIAAWRIKNACKADTLQAFSYSSSAA
jgi:hypothetical protein